MEHPGFGLPNDPLEDENVFDPHPFAPLEDVDLPIHQGEFVRAPVEPVVSTFPSTVPSVTVPPAAVEEVDIDRFLVPRLRGLPPFNGVDLYYDNDQILLKLPTAAVGGVYTPYPPSPAHGVRWIIQHARLHASLGDSTLVDFALNGTIAERLAHWQSIERLARPRLGRGFRTAMTIRLLDGLVCTGDSQTLLINLYPHARIRISQTNLGILSHPNKVFWSDEIDRVYVSVGVTADTVSDVVEEAQDLFARFQETANAIEQSLAQQPDQPPDQPPLEPIEQPIQAPAFQNRVPAFPLNAAGDSLTLWYYRVKEVPVNLQRARFTIPLQHRGEVDPFTGNRTKPRGTTFQQDVRTRVESSLPDNILTIEEFDLVDNHYLLVPTMGVDNDISGDLENLWEEGGIDVFFHDKPVQEFLSLAEDVDIIWMSFSATWETVSSDLSPGADPDNDFIQGSFTVGVAATEMLTGALRRRIEVPSARDYLELFRKHVLIAFHLLMVKHTDEELSAPSRQQAGGSDAAAFESVTRLLRVSLKVWSPDYPYRSGHTTVIGGCLDAMKTPNKRLMDLKSLYCPTGKNKNCLIECFAKAFGEEFLGRFNLEVDEDWSFYLIDFDTVRKSLKLSRGNLLGMKAIECLLRVFPCDLTVYKIEKEETGYYCFKKYCQMCNSEREINLLYYKRHYYLIESKTLLTYKKCKVCCQWRQSRSKHWMQHVKNCATCPYCMKYRMLNKPHRCPGTRQELGSLGRDIMRYPRAQAFTALNRTFFADFETFQNDVVDMTVYSASINSLGTLLKPLNWQGKKALNQFMNYCLNDVKEGTIVFYNGSGFDFLFVFNWLVAKKKPITSWLKQGNKILTIEIGKIVFWDMYLYTRCSLKAACKNYAVPEKYWKSDFDHSKVACYDDVLIHETEIKEYNNLDVISLALVYKNFATTVWKDYQMNCNETVTFSQMCFQLWTSTLPLTMNIILPDRETHDWFARALFGGRCGPQVKLFKSLSRKKIWNEAAHAHGYVPEAMYHALYDSLSFLDAVSLYPTVMKSRRYPIGQFRIVGEEMHDQILAMFEGMTALHDLRIGRHIELDWTFEWAAYFYLEVDVECPNDLVCCYLQEREIKNGKKGNLIYNLLPKKNQVYFGPELAFALCLGYKITAVHRIVRFEQLELIYEDYIGLTFEIKKRAKKDTPPYSVAKHAMNNVSGKMSQKIVDTEWHICYTEKEMKKIRGTGCIRQFEFIKSQQNNTVALLVELQKDDVKPTKPIHLGAAILAYSRMFMGRLLTMLNYKAWTQPKKSFHYTDTDSLIVPTNQYNEALCKHPAFFGKHLGALDDELDGGRIIAGCRIAPKTYIEEFLTAPKDGRCRLMWKVRCKGIPHVGYPIPVWETLCMNDSMEDKTGLRTQKYMLTDKDGEPVKITKYLTFDMFEEMTRGGNVLATFGMMNKSFFTNPNQATSIRVNAEANRLMNLSNWWQQGHRYEYEEGSYPKGHYMYNVSEHM